MCAGSIAAGIKQTAEIGDTVMTKTFRHGFRGSTIGRKLFALKSAPDCPVCIDFGSTVLFRNLPADLQARLGVGEEARAELVSPNVNFHASRDDVFRFDNGATIMLSQLPDGIELDVIPAQIVMEVPAELPDIEEEVVGVRR